eukprot:TRINITY_DN5088_c0_g1_i7.p1 TRINITY_DN5088_c0_g1~~TRINITY_DN5088_c0_g1_i7.p1  ORF type:complete len:160 (+),score=8.49 TRINITY_DN5088_c0_g1_i7:497-976(+)
MRSLSTWPADSASRTLSRICRHTAPGLDAEPRRAVWWKGNLTALRRLGKVTDQHGSTVAGRDTAVPKHLLDNLSIDFLGAWLLAGELVALIMLDDYRIFVELQRCLAAVIVELVLAAENHDCRERQRHVEESLVAIVSHADAIEEDANSPGNVLTSLSQ